MKYFLLIAGANYYPSGDTGDWIDTFETYEEAKAEISEKENTYGMGRYTIRGREKDWYEIVDLRKWIMR